MTEEKAGSLGRPWDDGECWVPAEDAGMWFDSVPFDRLRAGLSEDSGRLTMNGGRLAANGCRGLGSDAPRGGVVAF